MFGFVNISQSEILRNYINTFWLFTWVFTSFASQFGIYFGNLLK